MKADLQLAKKFVRDFRLTYSPNPKAVFYSPSSGSYNHIRKLEELTGLHDREDSAVRVRWINHLRKIVDRRMPRNKVGAPLTSDIDLLLATLEERREAVLRTLNLWEEKNGPGQGNSTRKGTA